LKQMSVIFVAGDESSEVVEPTNRPFDFPATTVASQFTPILQGSCFAILAMGRYQLNSPPCQPLTQRIAVGGAIVEQSFGESPQDTLGQERLNECHFVRSGIGDEGPEGQATAIDEHHDLGAFAAFGLADQFAPFFAEENVPSAIASLRLGRPWRARVCNSLDQALVQMPATVHFWKRRQQVGYEGKWEGRSFQRAPLRSTQRIPSTQRRGSRTGRPFWPVRGVCGNRSAINRHCSSVSSNLGSILDPAGLLPSGSRDRSVIRGLLSDHYYEIKQPSV
jgi:hypothetical protein